MNVEVDNDIFQTYLELIQVEVTGCCNMRCKHCRAYTQPKKMLNKEQMEKILDFASKVKGNDFKFTFSGGEPFMNPNLYDYLVLANRKGINQIVITTNASLVTDEWLKMLNDLKLKFLCIQISMDSTDAQVHNKFRGFDGAFEKCDELLTKIQKYKNINSSIRMTVTKDTINQIDDMIKYALSKKCKILGIGSVIPFGKAADGSISLKGKDKKEFIYTIMEKRKQYEGQIEIVTEDPLKFLCEYERKELDPTLDIINPCLFGGCTAGISSLNINSDGVVTPCSMMDNEVFNINDCKDADDMIKAYENSDIIKKLFSKKYSGKCGKCKLNRICGGCRAAAFAYTSDIMGCDESCWLK